MLATTSPWYMAVHTGELPAVLRTSRAWTGLVTGQDLGIRAAEALMAAGRPVGPVVWCLAHGSVWIAVSAAEEEPLLWRRWPVRRELACRSPAARPCTQVWLLSVPWEQAEGALTQLGALTDQLCTMRRERWLSAAAGTRESGG